MCLTFSISLGPDLDTDERRKEYLDRYYTEGVDSLTKEKSEELLYEYFTNKTSSEIEELKKIGRENIENEEDTDVFASLTLVELWSSKQNLENLSREDAGNLLNTSNILKYASQNVNELLAKMMETEMDRQGINDPERRSQIMDHMNKAASDAANKKDQEQVGGEVGEAEEGVKTEGGEDDL